MTFILFYFVYVILFHVLFVVMSLKMLGVIISVRSRCNDLLLMADGIANLFFNAYIL